MSYKANIELIKTSGFFDPTWYVKQYPDVSVTGLDPAEHYVRFGGAMGRTPGPRFDARYYLETNPDIRDAKLNPLLHYLRHGQKEGRVAREIAAQTTALVAEPDFSPATASSVRREDRPIIFVSGEAVDRPGFIYRVSRLATAFERIGERTLVLHRSELPKKLSVVRRAKLLYVWRAHWSKDVADAVQTARARAIPTVFDLDDLMVRPDLATAEFIDAIRFNGMNEEKVKKHYNDMLRALGEFDYCTASTDELAWQMRRSPNRKPTVVIPNGFDRNTYALSRASARNKIDDGLIRIGYASGSRTHQADFRQCSTAVADVLRAEARCRLVLFRRNTLVTLDPAEFPELAELQDRIEWRPFVPHDQLPAEVARFDINLAPLEHENPFCEAKSELKWFEAAICDVPTIASPTGPFRRAIVHGETGFLAATPNDWRATLERLVGDPALRHRIGREAHRRALWRFGPTRRADFARNLLENVTGDGRTKARAFQHGLTARPDAPVLVASYRIVFDYSTSASSRVTVIIPLFNYASYVIEALESVKAQTMTDLDLIVVDDCSTDDSQAVVLDWLRRHSARFNRALLVQHIENQGLGASRNTAFDLADTLYVMALDADNLLRSECCAKCFEAIDREAAAYAWPTLQRFGGGSSLMGDHEYAPARLIPGNSIDAMAMISKEAWSCVGGYTTHRMGWQDYDLWCRFAERGLHGTHVDEILGDYRVHNKSMLRTGTDRTENKKKLNSWMESTYPWLSLLIGRSGHKIPCSEE